MSLSYNQNTSDVVRCRMPAELYRYFIHQMLRIIEPVDAMAIDLHNFWRCYEWTYPFVFVIVCDLLILPVNIVIS